MNRDKREFYRNRIDENKTGCILGCKWELYSLTGTKGRISLFVYRSSIYCLIESRFDRDITGCIYGDRDKMEEFYRKRIVMDKRGFNRDERKAIAVCKSIFDISFYFKQGAEELPTNQRANFRSSTVVEIRKQLTKYVNKRNFRSPLLLRCDEMGVALPFPPNTS